MRKFVRVMTVAILMFSLATPVFAQNLLIRTIKGAFSPVVGSAEMVVTILTNVVKGKDGPIVSTLKGLANGFGRIAGDLTNIVSEGAYEVGYFEDNQLAGKIATPPIVDIADWAATGVYIGVVGVNSNWWGGAAKGWTRTKAVMIGATAGAVAGTAVSVANEE
ncbi:MAG: hypothetical protein AAB514_01755 [Patescibacteria group bacterium]